MSRLHRRIVEGWTPTLADAARELGVSSMTLRRDIATHGFGIELRDNLLFSRDLDERAGPDSFAPAYTLERQQSVNYLAKITAGRNAAQLIEAGDRIFVDNGTTTPHLLAALPATIRLTIVCNALNVALAATRLSRCRVHLLGGVLEPNSQTFFSEDSLLSLRRLSLDKAFISAEGISGQAGATCSTFALVAGKRAAVTHAARSFAVVDESKLDLAKPAGFAALHLFERIITDRSA